MSVRRFREVENVVELSEDKGCRVGFLSMIFCLEGKYPNIVPGL